MCNYKVVQHISHITWCIYIIPLVVSDCAYFWMDLCHLNYQGWRRAIDLGIELEEMGEHFHFQLPRLILNTEYDNEVIIAYCYRKTIQLPELDAARLTVQEGSWRPSRLSASCLRATLRAWFSWFLELLEEPLLLDSPVLFFPLWDMFSSVQKLSKTGWRWTGKQESCLQVTLQQNVWYNHIRKRAMQEVHVRRFRERSITLGNPSIAMLNEWQRRCRVSSRSLNELLEVLQLMIQLWSAWTHFCLHDGSITLHFLHLVAVSWSLWDQQPAQQCGTAKTTWNVHRQSSGNLKICNM